MGTYCTGVSIAMAATAAMKASFLEPRFATLSSR
jgi:hypothetical protein